MKMSLLVFVATFVFGAQAYAACEAQFAARAINVSFDAETQECLVKISESSTSHYSLPDFRSGICPLRSDVVFRKGIIYPAYNGECTVKAGQEISGVLVQRGQSVYID